MHWDLIDTGLEKAAKIMEKDRDLLQNLSENSRPILHFYEWDGPSITYGHFIDPAKFFSFDSLRKRGISLAKRPTGGGIIFHLWDFAFSVLVPASSPFFSENTLENYAFVNLAVVDALKEFLQIEDRLSLIPSDGALLKAECEHFCMAKPTRYDVMLEGKKVAGAAQRKTKAGFLHQGSISLLLPSKEVVEDVLLPEISVLGAMRTWTYPLLGTLKQEEDVKKARKQIKQTLQEHLYKRSDLCQIK